MLAAVHTCMVTGPALAVMAVWQHNSCACMDCLGCGWVPCSCCGLSELRHIASQIVVGPDWLFSSCVQLWLCTAVQSRAPCQNSSPAVTVQSLCCAACSTGVAHVLCVLVWHPWAFTCLQLRGLMPYRRVRTNSCLTGVF